jgi:hypothetical protein
MGRERGKVKMKAPDSKQELVVVFESDNPIELDIAKSALEEAGLEFVVPDEGRIGFGVTPILNPVSRIEVLQASEAQARDLLKNLFPAEQT